MGVELKCNVNDIPKDDITKTMGNMHFNPKSPKRSKGYYWTGVTLIALGSLILVFLVVILILNPITVTDTADALWLLWIVVPAALLILLGMFCIQHSKLGYIAQLGEGVDFSQEKLLGIVSVLEMGGEHVAKRDLRFYSSGILSPDPIPYGDISRIRVYKALGFIPRIEIRTRFGSKHRFNLPRRS